MKEGSRGGGDTVPEEYPWSEDDHPRGWHGQRLPLIVLSVVLVAAGLVLGLLYGLSGNSQPSSNSGPEGVPIVAPPDLASANTTAAGAPVDGITCRTAAEEVVRYHIHVMVNIFVNGHAVRLPAGAGIPAPRLVEHLDGGIFMDNAANGCLYWLHVHANDNVVHVEAPHRSTFTLGQFFDIWGQPLGPDRVGPANGAVVAFENGKRIGGDPRQLPLLPDAVIQLDVGQPIVPFVPVQFHVKGVCGAGTNSCANAG